MQGELALLRGPGQVGVSIDETTLPTDIGVLLYIFAGAAGKDYMLDESIPAQTYFDAKFARTSDFLQQDVFKKYHTETELMRYITRLGRKDVSLAQSHDLAGILHDEAKPGFYDVAA